MKDVIIFGAGGLGREMLFQMREINKTGGEYNILGFADDRMQGQSADGVPVLCGCEGLIARTTDTAVIIALGSPKARRAVYEKLSVNAHLSFPTVIAPGAVYSDRVRFGKGCIVGFCSSLTVDITLGDFVLVSNGCNVGHDARLDDFVTLYPGVHISGNVHLGEGCEMGVGSNIIQGLSVGEGSFVGAGATVVRDIPPHCTAVGVPAKPIRFHEKKI